MEKKTNYSVVGLIVLILAGALLAFSLWLSVGFDQKSYKTYAVFINESVSGLSEESPVKFNGVRVGYVYDVALSPHDPRQVRLLIKVESSTPITIDTRATLISQGITGTTYLGLSANSENLTLLQKKPGEKYPIIPSKPSLFHQIDSVIKEVSKNINDVSIEVKRVFDQENAEAIKQTLINMRSFTDVIAKNNQKIDETIENLAQMSQRLPEISKDIQTAIVKFNRMADQLSDASVEMKKTMSAGKNTIQQISQQTIPPATLLLRRLDGIAANIEKVSNEMKNNPAVIIRGTTPRKPGPGE